MSRLTYILIFVISLVVSCKSQKIKTKTDTKTEIRKEQQKISVSSESVKFFEKLREENLQHESFNYDFSLKSQDATKPARLTEFRNGKPYRTLLAENAEYTEKRQKNQISDKVYSKQLKANYDAFKKEFEKQNVTIHQLQTKIEKLQNNSSKITNKIKYTLWLLILIAIIWIAERTGLFRVIKRILSGL